MKLTQSELTAFLKGIGLASVELVEKEEESEFDNDVLLKSVDDNRSGILRPIIEAEVKETTLNGLKATAGGSLRSALHRKTGMKRTALDEFKTDDDAIEAAINYKIGLLDGEKAEVKKELDTILEAHKSEKETITNTYEGKLKEATDRYTKRDIKDFVARELKDAPIPKKADRDVVVDDVVNFLMTEHDLNWNEAEKMAALFEKGKDMPLMNAAKNQKVSILDRAKDFLAPRNLWEEDMSGRNPEEEMRNQRTDDYKAGDKTNYSVTNNITDKKKAFNEKLKAGLENQQV